MVYLAALVLSRREHSPLQREHVDWAVQCEPKNLVYMSYLAFAIP